VIKEKNPNLIHEKMRLVQELIGSVFVKIMFEPIPLGEVIAPLILEFPLCKPQLPDPNIFLDITWFWISQIKPDDGNYNRIATLIDLYQFIITEYNISHQIVCGQILKMLVINYDWSNTVANLLNQSQIVDVSKFVASPMKNFLNDASQPYLFALFRCLSSWPLTDNLALWYSQILDIIAHSDSQAVLYKLMSSYLQYVTLQLYIPAFRSGSLKILERVLFAAQSSPMIFHSLLDFNRPVLTIVFNNLMEKREILMKKSENSTQSVSSPQDKKLLLSKDLQVLNQIIKYGEIPEIPELSLNDLNKTLEQLSRICYVMCEKHSGHPERYIPLISAMRNQWDVVSSHEANAILSQYSTWKLDLIDCIGDFETDFINPVRGEKLGMVNIGNTCYMASFLQAFYHTYPLRTLLVSNRLSSANLKDFNISKNVQKLFAYLSKSIRPSVNLAVLKKSLNPPWCGFGQQDAFEFGLVLMDHLERTLPQTSKIFSGKFIQTITCKTCLNNSYRTEAFNTLTLQFPPEETPSVDPSSSTTTNANNTLEKLLEFAFSEEQMTAENQIFCEKCDKRQDGGKKNAHFRIT